MMTKAEWQASPRYLALKARTLEGQGGGCADCGAQGPLELHHLVYPYNKMLYKGPGWWGDEDDSDVVGLCRTCHHTRHVDINGDFWAAPEAMADHWWGYWHEMDKE